MKGTTDSESIIHIKNYNYLKEIIELHKNEFSNVLSGQIGILFLKYYYKKIIKIGVIYGHFKNNELTGFISGVINEKKIYSLNYYLYAITGIILHFFEKKFILSLKRHLKRIRLFSDVEIDAELLSIIVKNKFRGQGIGKELIFTLDDYFKQYKVGKYKVYTDMNYSTGYKLYDKLNFELFKEENLFGLKLRMYVKNIS